MTARPRVPRVIMASPGQGSEGGVAAVARTLSDNLDRSRFDLRWFVTRPPGARLRAGILTLGKWIVWLGVIGAGPDLVHIHSSWRSSFIRKSLFALPAYLRGVPVVFQVHPTVFLDYYREGSRLRQKWIRFILSRAARIVVLSELMAKALTEDFGASQLTVLPNPVDVKPFRGEDHPRQKRTLLFLGSLLPIKGFQDLVPLVMRLQGAYPDLKIVVCGNHGAHLLQQQIDRAGISGFFELRGWVGTEKKVEALKQCTALIMPSRSEGIPMALLEAMAAGTPILTAAVGGIPEVVANGVSALFFSAGDIEGMARAVTRVFEDGELAQRLGRAARARAEREFSAPLIAERLAKIYLEILGEK